jgi:hypothetical protein
VLHDQINRSRRLQLLILSPVRFFANSKSPSVWSTFTVSCRAVTVHNCYICFCFCNCCAEHRISVGAYGRAKLREYLQKLAGGERFDIGANLHSVRAEQEQLGVR